MNIVGILGSPSSPSRSAYLLELAIARLATLATSYRAIRPRDLPAQALLQADFGNEQVRAALRTVSEAELVVVATPIYKASYSGVLKAFLDLLPQDGLRGKTVLPLVTGGSTAHLLALDYALKPVLSALGARDIVDGVYATERQLPSQAEGGYAVDDDIVARLDRSVEAIAARARDAREREGWRGRGMMAESWLAQALR